MPLSPEQQKKTLNALVVCLAILMAYRVMTNEKPRTAPLTYVRGAVAASAVRPGAQSGGLQLFLAERSRKFPGVTRDLFRMENAVKPRPKPVVAAAAILPPAPMAKTPEELAAEAARAAADAARADLARFRFLGYLTERDSSLFLSRDGQVYVVRIGDPIVKGYRVKDAGRDYVVLLDTATGVEVRVDLSGGSK